MTIEKRLLRGLRGPFGMIVMENGHITEAELIDVVLQDPKTGYNQRLVDAAFNVLAA